MILHIAVVATSRHATALCLNNPPTEDLLALLCLRIAGKAGRRLTVLAIYIVTGRTPLAHTPTG